MNAGRLRTKLEVQSATEIVDDTGGHYTEYTDDFEIWGNITPNAGQNIFRSAKDENEVDGMIEIRYRDDITDHHRLKVVGTDRILEINSYFDPDGKKSQLNLFYSEVK